MVSTYKRNLILIIVVSLFCALPGFLFAFGYEVPNELNTVTGTIAEFRQRDGKWYDNLFSSPTGSYLKLEFENGSFFEATGINYDCIDSVLFENLQIGEEITVTYHDRRGGPNRIYGICYQGEDYLLLESVIDEYEQNNNELHVMGSVILFLSLAIGAVSLVINYKRNYPTKEECQ